MFLPPGDLTYGTLQGHFDDVREVGWWEAMRAWDVRGVFCWFSHPKKDTKMVGFLGISKWV